MAYPLLVLPRRQRDVLAVAGAIAAFDLALAYPVEPAHPRLVEVVQHGSARVGVGVVDPFPAMQDLLHGSGDRALGLLRAGACVQRRAQQAAIARAEEGGETVFFRLVRQQVSGPAPGLRRRPGSPAIPRSSGAKLLIITVGFLAFLNPRPAET